MIVELFIDGAFRSLTWLFNLIPITSTAGAISGWLSGAYSLLSIGAAFVPWDIVVFCIGNIVMWIGVHMIISAVRFVLDFIPLF